MLEFELRTTEKPKYQETKTGGISALWPVGMTWEEYQARLVPVGTFCTSLYGGNLLSSINDNNVSYHVVLVMDHVQPKTCIITNGLFNADPYRLVSFYIPLIGAIHAAQPWERDGNGSHDRPLTTEELKALFRDDRFLAVFNTWRQKTGFEFQPIGLGESPVEMPSESGAENQDKGNVTI